MTDSFFHTKDSLYLMESLTYRIQATFRLWKKGVSKVGPTAAIESEMELH